MVIAFFLIYLVWFIPTHSRLLNNIFISGIVAIFIIITLKWLYIVPTEQISDFWIFWDKAPSALAGQPLMETPHDYFAKFAYQTGFLVYIMTIVKLFGSNILAMQLLNVLYQIIILLLTYSLSNKLFANVRISRIAVILLAINIDWFALNSQADNQYLASMLYLLTFYLISNNKLWSFGLAGLTLAIGWIIRPIGPVILIAIICYSLWFILKESPKKIIGKNILLVTICFSTIFAAGFLVRASGLNPYGLANNDTEWKLISGLNYESNGTYSEELNKSLNGSESREINKATEKRVLAEQIHHLNEVNGWGRLFIHKLAILWARNAESIPFTGFGEGHSPKAYWTAALLGYLGSFLIVVFSWVGSFSLLKSKNDPMILLLVLTILGFTLAELIIEVQGRYRIELIPILSIIAGMGVESFILAINKSGIGLRNNVQKRIFPLFKISDKDAFSE